MDRAHTSPKGTQPQFSAYVCCGQTAGWTKMPLGTEVDLGAVDVVLDRTQFPLRKGHSSRPLFGPCLLWPRLLISAAAELLFLTYLSVLRLAQQVTF